MGEMLEEAWEAHAARLANCSDAEIAAVYKVSQLSCHRCCRTHSSTSKAIAAEAGVDTSVAARVAIGGDTRASTASLMKAAKDGCL
jgi:hypothetical protein